MANIEVQITQGQPVEVEGNEANVFIFGDISQWYGFSETDLIRVLKNNSLSRINLYINSPGGSLATGVTIHDLLRGSSAEVVAYLVGQCASSATVIAAGADRVIMSQQCLYLIHRPMLEGYQQGRSEDLRRDANTLDSWENILVNLYQRKTGLDPEAIRSLMQDEVWLEPDVALDLGFIDEVRDNIEINWELPSSGDEVFEFMTTVWNNSNDSAGKMTGNQTYRSRVLNLLEHNFSAKTINNESPAASDTGVKPNIKVMNVFDKIVNILTGQGIVPEDKQKDAVTALNSANLIEALAGEVRQRLITNTEDGEPAILEAPALTGDNILEAVQGMTPEQRQQLADIINPADEETDEESNEMAEAIEALQNNIRNLSDRIASTMGSGSTRPVTTNGASDITGGKNKDKDAKNGVRPSQITYLLRAVDNGQMTEQAFTKLTGLSVENARQETAVA